MVCTEKRVKAAEELDALYSEDGVDFIEMLADILRSGGEGEENTVEDKINAANELTRQFSDEVKKAKWSSFDAKQKEDIAAAVC